MALPSHLSTIKTPTPVYVVVGAGDYAVEKLRSVRLPKLDATHDVKDVPVQFAGQVFSTANTVYADLAARGESLVTRVRKQQATEDLQARASRTTSQAKGAATTAKKGARSTTTRAKATTTSARKSADAAGKAAKDAAGKTGR